MEIDELIEINNVSLFTCSWAMIKRKNNNIICPWGTW